jgi:hypothetical protein
MVEPTPIGAAGCFDGGGDHTIRAAGCFGAESRWQSLHCHRNGPQSSCSDDGDEHGITPPLFFSSRCACLPPSRHARH